MRVYSSSSDVILLQFVSKARDLQRPTNSPSSVAYISYNSESLAFFVSISMPRDIRDALHFALFLQFCHGELFSPPLEFPKSMTLVF